ncbi:MAG TPA: hypothetical protein VFZ37_19730 [Jiangellaceae bacterium]
MRSSWVAATVRARGIGRRRAGTELSRRIATAPDLDAGLALLAGTAFENAAKPGTSLRDAEHGIRAELLWELRVLAGWMPAAGAPLARALAARFEMSNIEAHRDRLAGGDAVPEFTLGTLATSWPRLAEATSLEQLRDELASSPWGDPGDVSAPALHDTLFVTWLRMVDASPSRTPAVAKWVGGGAALLAARTILTLEQEPSHVLARSLGPVIGWRWTDARSIAELRDALPGRARWALAGIDAPEQLWRAEAHVRGRMESDGFKLLRGAQPGPESVVGALAVLAVDAWRVRAALAAAAGGRGSSEVLDVVA